MIVDIVEPVNDSTHDVVDRDRPHVRLSLASCKAEMHMEN